MPSMLIEYRVRIRNAANTVDALTLTSVPSDTNNVIADVPEGPGSEIDLVTGGGKVGTYTVRFVDPLVSGTDRVITSQLADSDGQMHLLSRRAYVEERENGGAWQVVLAGYVNRIELESGIAYAITIGESNRLELATSAFTRKLIDGWPEPFADYLARWPTRGCLLGGPILGGWASQRDAGGWEATVAQVIGTQIVLEFTAGHIPPRWNRSTDLRALRDFVNPKAEPYFSKTIPPAELRELGDPVLAAGPIFAGLRALVTPIGGTRLIGIPVPYIEQVAEVYVGDIFVPNARLINNEGGRWRLRVTLLPGSTVPAVGTRTRVRVLTTDVSELCPIYYTGHPCDLLATLRSQAGIPLDAASVTAAKQAIGSDYLLSLRVPAAQELAAFAREAILGPFGLAIRPNPGGDDELIAVRRRSATAPSVTVTDDDLAGEEDVRWFEHEESSVLTGVVFTLERYLAAPIDGKEEPPPDGILVQEQRIERPFGDQTVFGQRHQEYKVPGFIHATGRPEAATEELANVTGHALADLFKRGAIEATLPVLRGTPAAGVREGEELLVNVKALPSRNKRLGDDPTKPARAMIVVGRTRRPWGQRLKLLDAGPNAQFTGTAPTLSLAASSGAPRTVAEVTVTNAATLNAELSGVRLQMAVTTGGIAASTDYVDLTAYAAGEVPTAAIALPAVTAGRTVYVRARSERATERPSGWTVGVAVTLTGLDAPTGLTATADAADGSRLRLAWTPGANAGAAYVEVYRRLSTESASDAVRIVALLAGSVRYDADGLTPGASYVFGVQHRDAATGDVSALTTVSVTAGGTTVTLSAPDAVVGFAGDTDAVTGVAVRSARIGLAARVATAPAFLEVEEQHEVAPAGAATRDLDALAAMTAAALRTYTSASTFSSWASFARVPVVPGQWTIAAADAPNDGCVRFLRARVVRDGATASAWASEVAVIPWSVRALLTPPAGTIPTLTGTPNTGTDRIAIAWTTADLPSGHTLALRIDDESVPAYPTTLTGPEEDVTGTTSYSYDPATDVKASGTTTLLRVTLEARLANTVLVSRSLLVVWYR